MENIKEKYVDKYLEIFLVLKLTFYFFHHEVSQKKSDRCEENMRNKIDEKDENNG